MKGAIEGLSYTTDMPQTLYFLGLCNAHCRFVPNFAWLAYSLNQQLKKDEITCTSLNESEKKGYSAVKGNDSLKWIQALPRGTGQFTVDTYAWDYQLGTVQLQKKTEVALKPIRHCCRKLSLAETRYDIRYKSFLIVIWVVVILWPYISGNICTVRYDYQSMKSILDDVETTRRLAKGHLKLMEFDFEIIHKQGASYMALYTSSQTLKAILYIAGISDEVAAYPVTTWKRLERTDSNSLPGIWDQSLHV